MKIKNTGRTPRSMIGHAPIPPMSIADHYSAELGAKLIAAFPEDLSEVRSEAPPAPRKSKGKSKDRGEG